MWLFPSDYILQTVTLVLEEEDIDLGKQSDLNIFALIAIT